MTGITGFAVGAGIGAAAKNAITNVFGTGATAIGTVGLALAAGVGSAVLNRTNSNYDINQNTVYPYDLIQQSVGRVFTISFQFYRYQRPSVQFAPFLNSIGTVTLPLPADLKDQIKLTYDEATNSPALGVGLNALSNGGQNPSSLLSSPSAIVSAVESIGTGGVAGVGIATSLNAEGIGGKISQLWGLAQNPFLTVLFQSPTFKRYTLQWTFSPDNQADSDTLKYIINKFRWHSLPDVNFGALAGTFLQYPDVVRPIVSPDGYMFDFHNCVVESLVVNPFPGNTPGFFNSGAPAAIQFTLSLLEIEIWLKQDMTNTPNPSNNMTSSTPPVGIT